MIVDVIQTVLTIVSVPLVIVKLLGRTVVWTSVAVEVIGAEVTFAFKPPEGRAAEVVDHASQEVVLLKLVASGVELVADPLVMLPQSDQVELETRDVVEVVVVLAVELLVVEVVVVEAWTVLVPVVVELEVALELSVVVEVADSVVVLLVSDVVFDVVDSIVLLLSDVVVVLVSVVVGTTVVVVEVVSASLEVVLASTVVEPCVVVVAEQRLSSPRVECSPQESIADIDEVVIEPPVGEQRLSLPLLDPGPHVSRELAVVVTMDVVDGTHTPAWFEDEPSSHVATDVVKDVVGKGVVSAKGVDDEGMLLEVISLVVDTVVVISIELDVVSAGLLEDSVVAWTVVLDVSGIPDQSDQADVLLFCNPRPLEGTTKGCADAKVAITSARVWKCMVAVSVSRDKECLVPDRKGSSQRNQFASCQKSVSKRMTCKKEWIGSTNNVVADAKE